MGTLAERLKELAEDKSVQADPSSCHEQKYHYRYRAVNVNPFLASPWHAHFEIRARKIRENSDRLARGIARERGTYIVHEVIGTDNLEHLKARELTKRVDGFGAVQFKIGKNPKKVTHIEVHQEPDGDFLVKALRFHKVRGVFEWIYEVEAERTVKPNQEISAVFSTLTGLNMGTIYAYKLQPADPTAPCPHCNQIFGPRADSHKVKGNDRIFCSLDCACRYE